MEHPQNKLVPDIVYVIAAINIYLLSRLSEPEDIPTLLKKRKTKLINKQLININVFNTDSNF